MNQANSEQLLREHPLLFRNGEFFDCLDGWYVLIRELSDALERLCARQKRHKKRPMVSSQVKEKLGGLRFYVDNLAPRAEKLIEATELLSRNTCEICGAHGSVRSDSGRLMALCELHAARQAEARKALDEDAETNLTAVPPRLAPRQSSKVVVGTMALIVATPEELGCAARRGAKKRG